MSSGATDGSSSPRTHSARSLICIVHSSAMFLPPILDDSASGREAGALAGSGQVWKVIARSTKARMCGCMASTSLESIDFWIFGMTPS